MSTLSKITGADAAHNASVAGNQAQKQIGLQNQYQGQGAGVYGGLEQQGLAQSNAYQQNYLNLLSKFGSMSGLGQTLQYASPGRPGLNAFGQTAEGQASGHGNQLYPGSQFNGAGGAQGQDANNPYSLDQYQQQQLNQTNANIAHQSQQATASFTQQMSARGITDPRALQVGTEQIQEHFAGVQAEAQTKFYEQVKTDKLQALQQIISGLSQYGQQGVSEQEAAGSGFIGLAGGAAAQSNALQSTSLQQQNLSNQQLGGLFNLLGFGFGGGFGGAGGGGNPALGGGTGGAAGINVSSPVSLGG